MRARIMQPNERSGVDAAPALCLFSGRQQPRATHRERYPKLAPG
jgi:hypothetical protein